MCKCYIEALLGGVAQWKKKFGNGYLVIFPINP
jgi:hypothetical protein